MSDTTDLDQIWETALEIIRNNNDYSETMMSLWFRDLRLTSIIDNNVVLTASSNFKKDIVRNKYTPVIEEAMSEIMGEHIIADIRSDEDQKNAIKNAVGNPEENSGKKSNPSSPKPVKPETETENNSQVRICENDPPAEEPGYFSSVGENKIVDLAQLYKQGKFTYTFDSFVVGGSNKLAYSACLGAASNPGGSCNPLFLYGPSGLGKTHLLFAITDYVQKNLPDKKVVYVKGEEFTNQLVDAISRNITPQFRERYRKADVLLIDDIQFIAGKVATQEEFFHTFNDLYENGKQIIIASDRPPKEMNTLEERLKSRFESGLMADIQPPDAELRMAIIKVKAETIGLEIPSEVIDYVATNLHSNVRQLEGAVKKIAAKAFLSSAKVTIDLAIKAISDMITPSETVTKMKDKVLNLVTARYNVTLDDLKSKKRVAEIAGPRHIAVYLLRNLTDMSFPAIGKIFQRDHSTIISSIETVETRMKTSPTYAAEIQSMIKELQE